MLMTPEPMVLRWGGRRKEDGGRRGRAKSQQYERSQSKPAAPAQPNRYDAMHAPVYQAPPASTPLRPGSDDFLRIASRGVRC